MNADEFLKIASLFKLGELPTEQPHPQTVGLSEMVKKDLNKAIKTLKSIDIECLSNMVGKAALLEDLRRDIKSCFEQKGRVFLCGCGATGRLSLALERIWREQNNNDRVISFMAGGDVALISSIEKFEDFPEYGARQLEDLGFRDGDILIASTEGGETPWVIGAVERATEISRSPSYFVYCNPDDILCKLVERSRKVIKNEKIKKINLFTGEMALAGSTRMQASTILMLGIGLALNYCEKDFFRLKNDLENFYNSYSKLDLLSLAPIIESEAKTYLNGEYCHYLCDGHLGISILTDTTERAPTFSLRSFENYNHEIEEHSLCYFSFSHIDDTQEAWKSLLGRSPRCIDWEEVRSLTSLEILYGHLIGSEGIKKRSSSVKTKNKTFSILTKDSALKFLDHEFKLPKQENTLFEHIQLKMILNLHSTLIMGILGRYRSNIMTWVKASNNKLIDRTARNVQFLMGDSSPSYEEIIRRIFELRPTLKSDEPLVLKVIDSF